MSLNWTSPATISALLATGLISLAPNLLLFLFPSFGDVNKSKNNRGKAILSLGQAIAAGGLLGDVFLHTLPHAMEDSLAWSGEGGLEIGQFVLWGFLFFLVGDGTIRALSGGHHCHSHEEHAQNGNDKKTEKQMKKAEPVNKGQFTSTVILNLAADALHNFTDGLAIGASFSLSSTSSEASPLSILKSQGGLASLSILFHEIPHELGDYAILVSSGFSKSEAILSQFLTAIAAFMGTIFGLIASHTLDTQHGDRSNILLLSFTSGGFVYLAACGIIPDILEKKASVKLRCAQLLAFCCGIGFMQLVAVLEHNYDLGDHHHGHGHGHGDSHDHHGHHHIDHDHDHHHFHQGHQHHEL